ncbi:hypothetical protein Q4601_19370 [Shewanella sp. 1_MG-2023]|uniref:hypothetical protein n=1 Tax=unclassified Shewanella TaxID=196818 RepID=UPI0026E45B84|nr:MULTISPECIES: hypothetical protein [unclassified Shewanella]MDO6612693.1 hypothetical protein [Shewanella sp. 7_MG-2023]MDO6772392.1 hypothetical protein [Shewanella sp. 2_MG-2023]MDO6796455.1 hypothetical protein [Shewanella sp. 1_MG-2023]
MLGFYRDVKITTITFPAMLARLLLILIFAMQSVVAMADNCALEHKDCAVNVELFTTVINDVSSVDTTFVDEHSLASDELCDDIFLADSHADDDCAECSSNCCSCCMTLMHPVTMAHHGNIYSDYLAFTFNSNAVEAPYFSFLRPPQA